MKLFKCYESSNEENFSQNILKYHKWTNISESEKILYFQMSSEYQIFPELSL